MRDEQQRRPLARPALAQPPVVQRRDDRLAGPGRGHDQVAVAIVHAALGFEGVEHLLLVGERAHLEPGQRQS